MNTISASAPAVRRLRRQSIRQMSRKLGNLIAPRDHAGKGNWNKDAGVPLWAWLASMALPAFFLFGPQMLARILRFAT